MRWIAFGRQFRTLRVYKDKRQVDVRRAVCLSRPLISRIDRGLIGNIRVGDLDRAATALGATLDVRLRWNGEQVDRLLDETHARLVDLVVALLRASGWEVAVEVPFSVWGERGSIDVFAYHRATGTVLVVEVKSVVPDQQAALHGLDRKARLARRLAEERGWACRGVARLLVVGDTATARRRVARHASTYDAAFPHRGRDVRRWLRAPGRPIAGLRFLAFAPEGSATIAAPARRRVRKRRTSVGRSRQGVERSGGERMIAAAAPPPAAVPGESK